MYVDMEDGLPRIGSRIDDEAVARLIDALTLRQLPCNRKKMPDQSFIVAFERVDGWDMPVGHDQDVSGSHRMDIAKGSRLFILEDNVSFDFFRNNFAEKARIAHFVFSSKVQFMVFNHTSTWFVPKGQTTGAAREDRAGSY